MPVDTTWHLRAAAYSPDGKHIAYSAEDENDSGELRVFDVELGRSRIICKTELPTVASHWSTEGGRIIFADRHDGNSEIFMVNSDGSGLTNLTNDKALDSLPVWSPDAKHILFVSNRDGSPTTLRLYLMSSDGADPHPLTATSVGRVTRHGIRMVDTLSFHAIVRMFEGT